MLERPLLTVVADDSRRPADDDAAVLRAIDDGDLRQALELLMGAHGDRVHGHCVRMLGDAALAEDVLQQVFEQAHDALPRFRRQSQLSSWLLGIAHHRCLDALKSSQRRRRRFVSVDQARETASPEDDRDERLDLQRAAAALEDCVAALSAAARSALLLHYVEGISFERLGALLHEKANTVQARVARAMPLLRQCLTDKGMQR